MSVISLKKKIKVLKEGLSKRSATLAGIWNERSMQANI